MHNILEKKLGYIFKDKKLLDLALTHSSVRKNSPHQSYERLEFIGDRVLGLSIADYLFKHHKTENEGSLAKRLAFIVSRESCAKIAEKLDLKIYIKALKRDLIPTSSILPDAVEAVLGAIYLDNDDFKVVREVTLNLWKELLTEVNILPPDYKTALQEWSQEHFALIPLYTILEQKGLAHAPTFLIQVEIPGAGIESAQGASKRQAEQRAAERLYKKVTL